MAWDDYGNYGDEEDDTLPGFPSPSFGGYGGYGGYNDPTPAMDFGYGTQKIRDKFGKIYDVPDDIANDDAMLKDFIMRQRANESNSFQYQPNPILKPQTSTIGALTGAPNVSNVPMARQPRPSNHIDPTPDENVFDPFNSYWANPNDSYYDQASKLFPSWEQWGHGAKGVGNLALGLGKMMVTPPQDAAREAAYNLANEYAVNESMRTPEQQEQGPDYGNFAWNAAKSVSPIPLDPLANVFQGARYAATGGGRPVSGNEFMEGYGELAPILLHMGAGKLGNIYNPPKPRVAPIDEFLAKQNPTEVQQYPEGDPMGEVSNIPPFVPGRQTQPTRPTHPDITVAGLGGYYYPPTEQTARIGAGFGRYVDAANEALGVQNETGVDQPLNPNQTVFGAISPDRMHGETTTGEESTNLDWMENSLPAAIREPSRPAMFGLDLNTEQRPLGVENLPEETMPPQPPTPDNPFAGGNLGEITPATPPDSGLVPRWGKGPSGLAPVEPVIPPPEPVAPIESAPAAQAPPTDLPLNQVRPYGMTADEAIAHMDQRTAEAVAELKRQGAQLPVSQLKDILPANQPRPTSEDIQFQKARDKRWSPRPTAPKSEMIARRNELRAQIDDAYRSGNMDKVIDLERELDGLHRALAGKNPGAEYPPAAKVSDISDEDLAGQAVIPFEPRGPNAPRPKREGLADIVPIEGKRSELQDIANTENVSFSAEGVHPDENVPITHPEEIGGYKYHRRGKSTYITHPDYKGAIGPFPNDDTAFEWALGDMDRVGQGERKGSPITPPDVSKLPRVDYPREGEEPQFQKTVVGKAQIKSNIQRSMNELTHGYNNPLEGIAVREGLQNAFDVVKNMLGGEVRIRFLPKHNSWIRSGVPNDFARTHPEFPHGGIEITDNGKGMSPAELEKFYLTLNESGKTGDPNATGGKGVGKAPLLGGGIHFDLTSVREMPDGTKFQSEFKGTPDQFMNNPPDIMGEQVPSSTPTGTRIRMALKPDQDVWYSTNMLNKIIAKSRGLKNRLFINEQGPDTPSDWNEATLKDSSNDTQIVTDKSVDGGKSLVSIYMDKNPRMNKSSSVSVDYLNNGMYQFSKTFHLDKEYDNVPDSIGVDIKPQVDENHGKYPFPVQRESIKDTIKADIEKLIKDKVVNPIASQRNVDLKALWQSMGALGKHVRSIKIFDPGSRLTPFEADHFKYSTEMKTLLKEFDGFIDYMLVSSGRPDWATKVVRTGLILDPTSHGIYIPKPNASGAHTEAAIMMNPFIGMENGKTPSELALDNVVTMLHEGGHVGSGKSPYVPLDPVDLNDPRVGHFVSTLMKEINEQGGLNPGHDWKFVSRMAELYGKVGTRKALEMASRLQRVYEGKNNVGGGYSPEFQRLLQIYKDSRGRPETVPDILTGTGTPQNYAGGSGENIRGNTEGYGGGTTPEEGILQQSAKSGGRDESLESQPFDPNWKPEDLAKPEKLAADGQKLVDEIKADPQAKKDKALQDALDAAQNRVNAIKTQKATFQGRWGQRGKSLGEAYRRYVGKSEEQTLDDMGPGGHGLVRMMQKVIADAYHFAGQQDTRMQSKMEGLKKEDFSKAVDVREGNAQTNDSQINQVAQAIAHETEGPHVTELYKKLKIKNTVTGRLEPFQNRANYFPHAYEEGFSVSEQSVPQLLRAIQSEFKVTAEKAKSILNEAKQTNYRTLDSMKSRLRNLPGYRKDYDVLMNHFIDMAKRAKEEEYMGEDTLQGAQDNPVNSLLNQIEETHGAEARTRAEGIVSTFLEKTPSTAEGWQTEAANALTSVQAFTKLSRSIIKNIPGGLVAGIARGETVPWLKSIGDTFTQNGRSFAKESGALVSLWRDSAKDIGYGSKGSKIFGIEQGERWLRTFSANLGKREANVLFDRVKNRGTAKPRELAQLADLLIEDDLSSVLKQDKLTPEQLARAANRMTDLTQGRADSLALPQKWTNNPAANVITQFKKFGFIQARNMKNAIKQNPASLPRILIAQQLLGGAANLISSSITGRERKEGIPGMIENATYAFGFGMISDALDASTSGGERAATFIGGPTLGDVAEAGDVYKRIRTSKRHGLAKVEPFAEAVTKRVPYFGAGMGNWMNKMYKQSNIDY